MDRADGHLESFCQFRDAARSVLREFVDDGEPAFDGTVRCIGHSPEKYCFAQKHFGIVGTSFGEGVVVVPFGREITDDGRRLRTMASDRS
ncbi:hypothetical protein C490_15824 [Natronobacterium gregoryi SP2]|uniref:Uncharacterized protein n=1 Tax=Natronobacterium gregoryi (strain ATCC 43098 / DSM 3393 / CCM 3738 / CIP 104747 / IAM 13177 / JCM 8860 / NBRC 102187 / NCIMB 2189 / SP2) TaxID=797304 RepID=L9XSX0_NATGS|nr:hypothetical protein C490_15824 [Natronobacterium gregoryi SP2]